MFGKRLIKARAKERNTTVEAQATQLKNAFSQTKLAQRVRRLTGKQRGAPLQSVNVPADNSNVPANSPSNRPLPVRALDVSPRPIEPLSCRRNLYNEPAT
jgi:hypothetical protein